MWTTLNAMLTPTLAAIGDDAAGSKILGIDPAELTLWHVAAVALGIMVIAMFVMLRQHARRVSQLQVECGRLQQVNTEVVSQRNTARSDAETLRHDLISSKGAQQSLDTYFEQVNDRMERRLQEGVRRALADHGDDLANRLASWLDDHQGKAFSDLAAPVCERLDRFDAAMKTLSTERPIDPELSARLDRIDEVLGAMREQEHVDTVVRGGLAQMTKILTVLSTKESVDTELRSTVARIESAVADLRVKEAHSNVDAELRTSLERMESSIGSLREQVGVDAGLRECLERLESSVHASLAHDRIDTELHARLERLENAIREMPRATSTSDDVDDKLSRIQSALAAPQVAAAVDPDLRERLERIEASITELREPRPTDGADDERLTEIQAAQSEIREQMQHIIYALPRYEFVSGQARLSAVSTPSDYVAAFGRKVHVNQTGRNVLYADGNVRWVAEEDLPALVEEQNILRSKDEMPPIALPDANRAASGASSSSNKNGKGLKARLAS